MKKLLQVLTTAVVGTVLMGGVVGATGTYQNCSIYQSGSTSYNSCQTNTNTTSVRVTCVNNVYVIDNSSQQAGTGNATITSNGSGGYVASGNATNQNGATVNIGASCGQASAPASSSSSPSSSSSCGSSKTCPTSSASTPAKMSVSASSLPETGSNSVVNGAVIATATLVGVLGISYAGSVLYRRLAFKE